MKLTFQLGFALVCLGAAIAGGTQYLDLRQFEGRIDRYATHTSVSGYFGKGGITESKDISPQMAIFLSNQLTSADQSVKMQLEQIRDEVSKKKSEAIKSASIFSLFALMMLSVHYSKLRKAKAQLATPA